MPWAGWAQRPRASSPRASDWPRSARCCMRPTPSRRPRPSSEPGYDGRVPPPQDLRPLELGELIDRTITFWRAHLKPLFALGLGFELVIYAFAKALSLGLLRLSAGDPSSQDLPSILALSAGLVVLMVL